VKSWGVEKRDDRTSKVSVVTRAAPVRQFHSRVRAIAERQLNPADVESAEQLARTTTRKSLMDGTGTGNQTTRRWNKLPDTGRDTSNHSRFPLRARN